MAVSVWHLACKSRLSLRLPYIISWFELAMKVQFIRLRRGTNLRLRWECWCSQEWAPAKQHPNVSTGGVSTNTAGIIIDVVHWLFIHGAERWMSLHCQSSFPAIMERLGCLWVWSGGFGHDISDTCTAKRPLGAAWFLYVALFSSAKRSFYRPLTPLGSYPGVLTMYKSSSVAENESF